MKQKITWGFGLTPLKPSLASKNTYAVEQVKLYLTRQIVTADDIKSEISTVKGLFNRIIKQDQCDWFTINQYFDYPRIDDLPIIVRDLNKLRISIKEDKAEDTEKIKKALWSSRCLVYLENYLTYDQRMDMKLEYIYILSGRTTKNILKIGGMVSSIEENFNKLNEVIHEQGNISPRRIYKVKNSVLAERLLYERLEEFSITSEQGIFQIKYSEARKIIEECLQENNSLIDC